ncbi:MAG: DUF4163 domain-containing protein [Saprospiraceae bacterium]|nr:DUF3298 and DUF4163 domain-containing protein [Lewinella sp.]
MKHISYSKSLFILIVYCTGFFSACSSDSPAQSPVGYGNSDQNIVVEQRNFAKQSEHCAVDSLHCMTINLSYPYVVSGPASVIDPINDTISIHLKRNVAVFAVESSELETSLEDIARKYIQEFDQLVADSPEYPFSWEIEVEGSVFYQSDKVLSVALNAYAYTGGAHPNFFLDLINFDLATGRKLTLNDIFSNLDQLKVVVENKFREVREIDPKTSIADAGFFWGEPFALPESFALQEDGVYFFYNPYEAAAYALGATEFTIPYEDLKDLMKGP